MDHFDALTTELKQKHGPDDIFCGAEVGVYRGHLSRHLLTYFASLRPLYLVDKWQLVDPNSEYGKCSACAMQTAHGVRQTKSCALSNIAFAKDRTIILQGDSVNMASNIDRDSLDFVFLDADHTYDGLSRDLIAWAPKVKPYGLLCGHDIDSPAEKNWGVRKAVSDWLAETGARIGFVNFRTNIGSTWFLDNLPEG